MTIASTPSLAREPNFDPRDELRWRRPGSTPAKPYDVRESDRASWSTAAEFDEFKKLATAKPSSPALPTSHGMPIGILANNGILFSESAQKAAHFIQLC